MFSDISNIQKVLFSRKNNNITALRVHCTLIHIPNKLPLVSMNSLQFTLPLTRFAVFPGPEVTVTISKPSLQILF